MSACRLIGSNEPVPRERRLNPPVTERLNDSAVNRAVTSAKKKRAKCEMIRAAFHTINLVNNVESASIRDERRLRIDASTVR